MTQEALKLALEALEFFEDTAICQADIDVSTEAITAIKEALAQPEQEQEPVTIDQATMELAESVGLIGPTSRTHDLHQAIQRFHDLICVNATVKAAQMAADVICESTPPQRKPLTDLAVVELWPGNGYNDSSKWHIFNFARKIEAAHGIKE